MKSHSKQIIAAVILLLVIVCGYSFWENQKSDGDISPNANREEVINKSIKIMKNAKSFDYKVYREDSTELEGKRSESQSVTSQKLIFDPYSMWSKTETTATNGNNEKRRIVSEIYQVIRDHKMEFNLRYGGQNGSDLSSIPLSEWEKSSYTEKDQIDLAVKMNQKVFEAEFYLLSANIDSFQLTEDADAMKKNLIRYDGFIAPETAVIAYRDYLRDSYVQMKFIADSENLSLEDLKNEIVNGERPELRSGVPKLAYSEGPVPVSLWIDKETYILKKVMIDEKSLLQTLMEKEIPKINQELKSPIVEKSLIIYEINSVDQLKEISRPD